MRWEQQRKRTAKLVSDLPKGEFRRLTSHPLPDRVYHAYFGYTASTGSAVGFSSHPFRVQSLILSEYFSDFFASNMFKVLLSATTS